MNTKYKLKLALSCISILLYSAPSLAVVRAEASINVAGMNQRYSGLGNTEAEAVASLRSNCASYQALDAYKTQCKVNTLLNLSYNSIPNGSYLKSCGLPYGGNPAYCRMNGTTLECSTCKPVMEKRTLDMNQCPGDAYNNVSNCGGDLVCDGRC